jgi:hypothetical protein
LSVIQIFQFKDSKNIKAYKFLGHHFFKRANLFSGVCSFHFDDICTEQELVSGCAKDSLNAKTLGDMYAGDIEHRGVDYYLD